MKNPENSGYDDLDDLLRQVDALVGDSPDPAPAANPAPDSVVGEYDEDDFDEDEFDDDFDPEDFTPDGCGDDPVLYQNYSNHYGADIRNYSNGYGGAARPTDLPPEDAQPVIPAYNADFQRLPKREKPPVSQYRDYGGHPPAEETEKSHKPKKEHRKKRRRSGCGCGCTTMLIVAAVLVAGLFGLYHMIFRMPEAPVSIGDRKKDSATILLCGTDWEGARTDTMMLLYLSGKDRQVGVLSLPRDTYTITSGGYAAKLNSAYGRNGSGEEGMEGLLDYVQEIIGYRPDGYVLVSMDLVTQIVDLMGGLEVEVPMTFDLEGEHLEQGLQQLTGNEVLQLLRFREGYAMQDLDRVEVQRSVLKAAVEQWVSPGNLTKLREALSLVENHSITTLSAPNCLWAAKVLLGGMKNIQTDTLPGYATYIDGISYYLLDRDGVAALINESYNPYEVEILPENLKIAG